MSTPWTWTFLDRPGFLVRTSLDWTKSYARNRAPVQQLLHPRFASSPHVLDSMNPDLVLHLPLLRTRKSCDHGWDDNTSAGCPLPFRFRDMLSRSCLEPKLRPFRALERGERRFGRRTEASVPSRWRSSLVKQWRRSSSSPSRCETGYRAAFSGSIASAHPALRNPPHRTTGRLAFHRHGSCRGRFHGIGRRTTHH